MNQQKLKKALNYNKDTGIFTWLRSKNSICIGDEAGTVMNRGYRRIKIDGELYLAHRLAFLYMTGEYPTEVDHKNHKRTDNRWANLSAGDRNYNMKNKTMYSSNKSGFTGVFFHKVANKWAAQIRVNKKRIHLGVYSDISDAIVAREQANKKYNFHKNHGTK